MKNAFSRLSCIALLAVTSVLLPATIQAQPTPAQPPQAQAAPHPAITVSVATERTDAIYRVGEKAVFSIKVQSADGLVPGGEVSYQLSLDGVGDLGKGVLPLQQGAATISGTLDKPGILRCTVTYMTTEAERKVGAMAAAAFDPFKIEPTATVPADFDEFWTGQKAELAKVAPAVQLELVAQPNATVETYKISLANINGSRVRGYFSRPKAPGSYPAILEVPGAGVRAVASGGVTARAARGFLAMEIGVHDIPVDNPAEYYEKLSAGDLKGYQNFGREDRTTYYFRRVILGCLRSVDYLTSRPEWDKHHMIINGSSQGGALSLATAGLDSRITALAANVPAMSDHTGRAFGRPSGWPQLIPVDADGKLNPQITAVSGYYDSVNFARRIRVPAIVGVGLIDTTCPPTTVFSAYNVLQGPRQIDIAPLMGHAFNPSYVQLLDRFILESAAQPQVKNMPTNSKPDQVTVIGQKVFPVNLFKAVIPEAGAALQVLPFQEVAHLLNPAFESDASGVLRHWQKWEAGFTIREGEGRNGGRAIFIERSASDKARGIWQNVVLDQKVAQPILLSGWSRAEGVTGNPDFDYSLYADVTYQDGTSQWAENAAFNTGTHDWQQVRHIITPQKPIKSMSFYALFRVHTGRVWFSDLSVTSLKVPEGAALIDSLAVQQIKQLTTDKSPQKTKLDKAAIYRAADGLALEMADDGNIAALRLDERNVTSNAPGGFLVRDVANASDYHPLRAGRNEALKLQLEAKVTEANDHIAIEGRVADLSGQDRAISLVFALPVDARGWSWGQTMRESSVIGDEERSNTVAFAAGSNGRHSLYPLANIHDEKSGLTIAIDPDFAAQNRLAVNAATRQFYITYDFGFTPEKSDARFRFVIYRTDPQWGFRAALAKMGRIFPAMFAVRGAAKKQGLWMPFTDIRKVGGWQDFGFRFREGLGDAGDGSLKWDDENEILTFRYHEPMTWWMKMSAETPRTYEAALAQLQQIASDPKAPTYDQARAVISSGFRDATGRYAVTFRETPWANGAVWSINPDPNLPGESTGASIGWSPAKRDALYKNNPAGDVDGEFLDSLEGYVTSTLNFDRDAFKVARSPLTFDTTTGQPAQHKALLVYDYTRWQSREVHSMGKLMFANSVPNRFTFLAPWIDVLGTETDWLSDGKLTPDSDAAMSLRRAMSGTKPYLLLQNTDFEKFTTPYVEKYMQRALFYGMFPGFFSADASTKPYWLNPTWYNRDRALFKKYMPIIKPVAEAGWQAETFAKSDNSQVWVERFGTSKGPLYLTLRNNASTPQAARLILQAPLSAPTQLRDLVSGQRVLVKKGVIEIHLQPDQTTVLKLR
jgi:cephalosporin-C deacetylase-like acetyl esterase